MERAIAAFLGGEATGRRCDLSVGHAERLDPSVHWDEMHGSACAVPFHGLRAFGRCCYDH